MELRGSRETGLLVGLLVAVSRGVDGVPLWIAATLTLGVAVMGTANVLGELRFWRRLPAVALPALAAFAAVGGAHLLPIPLLVVGAPAAAIAVAMAIDLSTDGRAVEGPPVADDAPALEPVAPDSTGTLPAVVQAAAFGLGFLAFAAVGGVVPNGLGGTDGTLTPITLVATVALDAAVAAVMGLRLVAMAGAKGSTAAFAVNHYVAIAGHLGALVRLVNLPRLVGPAIVTVALYLWFEFRRSKAGSDAAIRVPETMAPVLSVIVTTALLCWPFAVR